MAINISLKLILSTFFICSVFRAFKENLENLENGYGFLNVKRKIRENENEIHFEPCINLLSVHYHFITIITSQTLILAISQSQKNTLKHCKDRANIRNWNFVNTFEILKSIWKAYL